VGFPALWMGGGGCCYCIYLHDVFLSFNTRGVEFDMGKFLAQVGTHRRCLISPMQRANRQNISTRTCFHDHNASVGEFDFCMMIFLIWYDFSAIVSSCTLGYVHLGIHCRDYER
jgi:hypothetical protein